MRYFFYGFLAIFSLNLAIINPAQTADKIPTLLVHTYSSFAGEYGIGPLVKREFEAICQCRVKYITHNNVGEMVNKLANLGSSLKADVVVGYDETFVNDKIATKILQPHQIDTLELENMHLVSGANEYSLPFDRGVFALIHSTKNYPNPPRNFNDLLTSKDKLILIDPRVETVGRGFLYWVRADMGDNMGDFFKKISKKTITYTKNWDEAYGLFLELIKKDQPVMVVSYWSSQFYHEITEKRTDIKAVIFDKGHYAQTELMGVSKNTTQFALAQKFVKFMESPVVQRAIPTTQWMMPAVITTPIPREYATASEPRIITLNNNDIFENKNQWLKIWQKNK